MSCCDTNKHDCSQGRNCRIQSKVAEQRVDFMEQWIVNYRSVLTEYSILIAIIALFWILR